MNKYQERVAADVKESGIVLGFAVYSKITSMILVVRLEVASGPTTWGLFARKYGMTTRKGEMVAREGQRGDGYEEEREGEKGEGEHTLRLGVRRVE